MAADDDADDKPLSQLCTSAAKKKLDKGAKTNDDTPLSDLVAKASVKKAAPKDNGGPPPVVKPGATPAAKPGAKPRGRPPGAGKAKAKAKNKSSSSSSSSSDSNSSSSDSEEARKQQQRRKKLLKRKQDEAAQGTAEDNYGGAVKKKERSQKEELVAQLLSRWWYSDEYVQNDWPPQEEEYYQEQLQQRKLRKVTIQEWEWVPEEDEAGRRKVYELSQFRGVFRNSSGDLIDLRPKETCPCYNNFMKKDMAELCKRLISAYENQLKDLKNSKYPEDRTEADIKTQLVKIRKLLHEAQSLIKS